MKPNTVISLFLVLSLAASAAHAGTRGEHRGRQPPDLEKRVQHMAAELDLSDEQSSQLLGILQASAAEREALREKIDRQFKPEMCAIHLDTMEQIREILTAEQAAEMEERLDRLAEAADSRGGRGHMGRLAEECQPEN